MADSEWFRVETSAGTPLAENQNSPDRFPNRESAADAARRIAPLVSEDTLIVVKYTRKEIRTFKKKVTVDEADVPS
jgi:hypothetical protein